MNWHPLRFRLPRVTRLVSAFGLGLFGLGLIAASSAQGQSPAQPAASETEEGLAAILAPDAELKLLHEGFDFTEGPAADAKGNVYFTDQPNDAIHVWTVEGELKTFLQPAGRSNGLYFDAEGTLWACADQQNQLWSITMDGEHQVQVREFDSQRLNGPNDLWIHPDSGVIYFTDPFYRRPYWDPPRENRDQPGESVYRFVPETGELNLAAGEFQRPNGIIGNAKDAVLYVADIGASVTYRFPILPDGSLGQREKFCASGSDGMTIDDQGNVYLTGSQGVTVFTPEGEKLGVIRVPERWSANVTFGGADRSTLMITASDALYAIPTRVRGR